MAKLSGLLLALLAGNAVAQDHLLPLEEYVARSAERAITSELARVLSVARTDLPPDVRRIMSRYESVLRSELRRVQSGALRERPLAVSIANGVNTAQYPSVGALLYSLETVCSGTLIGARQFLTARHCFPPSPDADLYAVYLQHAGIRTVADITPYPGRDEVDLAVLTLHEPVTGVAPSLPPQALTAIGRQRQIVGFGLTTEGASDSGLKREGGITTSACPSGNDLHLCWELNPMSNLSDSPSNVCYKDSGGPVGAADPGGRLQVQDAVVTGLTPGANCQTSLVNLGLAVLPHIEWLASTIEPGVPSGLPDCCGAGVTVVANDGQLPRPGGSRFQDWRFDIPASARVVRVSLNAMDIPSSNLKLDIRSTETLPASPGCKELGRYESCEYRFSDAPPAIWAARVKTAGGARIDYQLVVTMFDSEGD